jgi:hypothetical protein
MHKALIAALIAVSATGATAVTTQTMIDEVVPVAAEAAAAETARRIADAAYLDHLLGTSWPAALKEAAATARNNEALTVTGTTLTWQHDEYCYRAELPTAETTPTVRPC